MRRWVRTLVTAIISVVSLVGLPTMTGHAAGPDADPPILDPPILDPLTTFNRLMHDFNVRVYGAAGEGVFASLPGLPPTVRRGLVNFYRNMTEPVSALTSALRGEYQTAGVSLQRFWINVTEGYGGIYDRAGERGIRAEPRHLGEALCAYGLPDGPYLVLPLYGPATVADFLGAMIPPFAGYAAFGYAAAAYGAGYRLSTLMDEDTARNPAAVARSGGDYEAERERYLSRRRTLCPGADGEPGPARPR